MDRFAVATITRAVHLATKSYEQCTWELPGDVEVLVEEKHLTDTVVLNVAIRGTEADPRDVKRDLKTYFRKFENGPACVHAGFGDAALRVRAKLVERFKTFDTVKLWTVNLSGHSLGGAVATILAAHLRSPDFTKEHPRVHLASLVTIGAPRVGCSDFAELFEKRCYLLRAYRIQNAMDPVTVLPLWILGYRHPPMRHLYLNHVGAFHDPNFLTRFILRIFTRKTPLGAHSCRLYLERVLKFVGYEDGVDRPQDRESDRGPDRGTQS